MPGAPPDTPSLPSRQDILDFLADCPGPAGRRELARAFSVKGRDRGALGRLLTEMRAQGLIDGDADDEDGLPPVGVVEVTGTDEDGEVLVRPLAWRGMGAPPVIHLEPDRRKGPAPGPGDRMLARLEPASEGGYRALIIRRISARKETVIAILGEDGALRATQRRRGGRFSVASGETGGAQPGELVRAEIAPGRRAGTRRARVVERLGQVQGAQPFSAIAIAEHAIPERFDAAALAEAAEAGAVEPEGREDLRELALVTIDGADARDFDDAVWAAADTDPANPGGWRLTVAIADVAHYVRDGAALDASARERGNSVYFPDKVVPMLPEALSAGWCSLKPGEERPCLALHLQIDAGGLTLDFRFSRALMCSAARLTYDQMQDAHEGRFDAVTAPLAETVIAPLYGAFGALQVERRAREPLDMDLPERRAVLDDDGRVSGLELCPVLDSHRLIEAFMIAANVAAAETLEGSGFPCMHRVHEPPPPDKLDALHRFLADNDLKLAKGQVIRPRHFNRVLAAARALGDEALVADMVLRTQSRACYSPKSMGHYGLALRRYAHFTSPIRRYADLLVHRALISALKLGEGGLAPGVQDFEDTAKHISETERRAQAAERDAQDRFASAYMETRKAAVFQGRISGISRAGLFVTLADVGADGLVPASTLGQERFRFDRARQRMTGTGSGRSFRLGQRLDVVIAEAEPLTGGLILEILEHT